MTKSFLKKTIILQVSLANNIEIIRENYINFTKIYENLIFFIICPKNNITLFKKKLNKKNIFIINEDEIISLKDFKKIFLEFNLDKNYKKKFLKRLNWYYQQILKLTFVLQNKNFINNNSIIWDADTILLKKIDFFNEKKSVNYGSIFEYHRSYFFTLNKILNFDVPKTYLSSINQFISLVPKDVKKINKILLNDKHEKEIKTILSKKILSCIFAANKNFNHSMFSEYETIGLIKSINNKNFNQKIIFFLRYKINGKLTNFQKKICKFLNCKHVTYEEHSQNKKIKKLLTRKQKLITFIIIVLKQYIKFVLRKIKYLMFLKFYDKKII